MCLIAWSWQPGAPRTLLLAANRDEWLSRPAEPMHWWEQADAGAAPILAGRDLLGGGTWLGLRRDGLFAALTNVREPGPREASRPSRGQLALRFLQGLHPHDARAWRQPGAQAWAEQLRPHMQAYAGFNLLLADLRHGDMAWVSNRAGAEPIGPGVHGLSNAALDTPWPKVRRLKSAVEQCLRQPEPDATEDFERLLAHLSDPLVAPDAELPPPPDGMRLSQQWSRGLSAAFIRLPDYGTRCSTLLQVDADGHVQVVEVQHHGERADAARREFHWNWREA